MELKEDPAGCPQCDGKVFYKKSTYFGKKVYYKVCNKCGWYRTYPRDEWYQICFGVIEDTGDTRVDAEKQETNTLQKTETEKAVETKPEESPPSTNGEEPAVKVDSDSGEKDEIKTTFELINKPEEESESEKEPKRGRRRGRKPKKKTDNEEPTDNNPD